MKDVVREKKLSGMLYFNFVWLQMIVGRQWAEIPVSIVLSWPPDALTRGGSYGPMKACYSTLGWS